MILPLKNKVLIRVKEEVRTRASGLYIPETKDERAQEGVIEAIGSDVDDDRLKVGLSVYFGKFSTDQTPDSGLKSLRDIDILAVIEDGKIRPLGKILVRMVPVQSDYRNVLGLTLMDQKKHWNHEWRRGKVEAMDPRITWKVPEILLGDIVLFKGSAGFTMDGDIMDEDDKYDEPLKGESFRWLKAKEILAIDERETIHA